VERFSSLQGRKVLFPIFIPFLKKVSLLMNLKWNIDKLAILSGYPSSIAVQFVERSIGLIYFKGIFAPKPLTYPITEVT